MIIKPYLADGDDFLFAAEQTQAFHLILKGWEAHTFARVDARACIHMRIPRRRLNAFFCIVIIYGNADYPTYIGGEKFICEREIARQLFVGIMRVCIEKFFHLCLFCACGFSCLVICGDALEHLRFVYAREKHAYVVYFLARFKHAEGSGAVNACILGINRV